MNDSELQGKGCIPLKEHKGSQNKGNLHEAVSNKYAGAGGGTEQWFSHRLSQKEKKKTKMH